MNLAGSKLSILYLMKIKMSAHDTMMMIMMMMLIYLPVYLMRTSVCSTTGLLATSTQLPVSLATCEVSSREASRGPDIALVSTS